MSACKESSSKRDPDAVVIRCSADVLKANSLIDELKRRDIEVRAAHTQRDCEAVLRHFKRRCVVYLSQQPLSDLCKSTVSRFANQQGRDAVVVVIDDRETPPDEFADFLCLRYAKQHLNELCRELALLIQTPLLPCRPQDIDGYATAFRVRNGYLRFVLPNFHLRLKELYTAPNASCVKKLLIIFSESCCYPPSMEMEGSIERLDAYILRNVTRAGQQHRDFSASAYSIRDTERNCTYYFSAEFDNSLASLSDIQMSGLAGIDENRMYRERNRYILHLKQLLQHGKDASKFTGQYRILYWRDREVTLDKFLLPIVREELEKGESEPMEVSESPIDFLFVDGPGVNPASLYANPAGCYKLDSEPKGVCLIINIANFERSARTDNDVPRNLETRIGTEADVRQLKEVFEWLKFKVEVHRNVNKSDFLRIINETWDLDHTAYDAFVCCIMSHGRLGHIYTADSQLVGILEDIAHAFYPDSCPTLAGKPKMFFVQSCQVSRVYGSVEAQGAADDSQFSATATTDAGAGTRTALETKTKTLLLPDAPDFFMSYSTLPRNLSFRLEKGTLYVQALTEVLKKGLELQASLYEVAQRVEQKAADNGVQGQQRPFFYVSTERKSVFLCGKFFV